jgi:hypothetical protein
VALILLGVAASVLVLGSVVATVVLWDPAPVGARLALVVLDIAIACFYSAVVVLVYQNLAGQKRPKRHHGASNRNNDGSGHNQGHLSRPPEAQFKIARRIASEMNTTLVRQRDGTCYLKLGPVEGRIPVQNGVVRFREQGPDWVEASTYSWLCMMADALDAELVYDGGTMEWHLRWQDFREIQGGQESEETEDL